MECIVVLRGSCAKKLSVMWILLVFCQLLLLLQQKQIAIDSIFVPSHWTFNVTFKWVTNNREIHNWISFSNVTKNSPFEFHHHFYVHNSATLQSNTQQKKRFVFVSIIHLITKNIHTKLVEKKKKEFPLKV